MAEFAESIMEEVRRLELPLRCDGITPPDGSCFYWAIWQQLQRPEVREGLSVYVLQHSSSHLTIKTAIIDYILNSNILSIRKYKQQFMMVSSMNKGKSWSEYWSYMREPGIMAEDLVIPAAAWW